MLELTPWSPQTQIPASQGAASSDEELITRMRALVRWYLPRHEEVTAKHWAFGRFIEAELVEDKTKEAKDVQQDIKARHQVALGLFPDIRLQKLEWRLVDERTVQNRFMGHWQVEGYLTFGEAPHKRVDFLGEFLRDGATGSFREFVLSLVK
jgi:hypothetical protein